ncbi:DUF4062 domain-containing protein [Mesorhizobium sp. C120A]|uniref:DUF4062 domain-containing protein n=1 Tax=unclassified Mesorhizobium TaxID=325217 RepID=UPI0004CEC4C2|nr:MULTISPECIES: DUF4062 domain-containing protein [unclassified Mesorhizobium]WJI42297.1 DUF4062 domain-containing protein [Mesorhizobium sp. C120A]
MAYSVRHQVFVSSTFTDLKDERAEVIQAIWELDCIPTGMEAFVASNESQWDVIKRVIDECDYYVLIIGGRYGSVVTDEDISYTEKEYRYAKKSGIPVLAFVHGKPEEIAAGKTEKDEAPRKKLESFRAEIMNDYPVRKWSSASELGGLVSRSLIREIKINPRPGWIRNDGSSPIALLEKINVLTEENIKLRGSIENSKEFEIDESLESGKDKTAVRGYRTIRNKTTYDVEVLPWKIEASWDVLFQDIGPSLINESSEESLKSIISRFHSWDKYDREKNEVIGSPAVNLEAWNEILIQFRALGLIQPGIKKRAITDKESYWRITLKGDRHLVSLLAKRKKPKPTDAGDLVA